MVTEITSYEVVGRKDHVCFCCCQTIPKGERHEVFVGKIDHVYRLRYHLDCRDLSFAYNAKFPHYHFDDGIPSMYEAWTDGGEFERECGEWRGHFPHAVTRIELHYQLLENKYEKRYGTS